jgi:HNH endonuclease
MSITLRDHKMLWGMAGGRCSICKIPLAAISKIGVASVIGEEAHIVARSFDGPRGESPLRTEQRDSYPNLILMCPTHHSVIDDLPNGPLEYSVEKLHTLKAEHEQWVMSQGSFDAELQLHEVQWAAVIDALDKRMSWDSWTQDMSLLFSHDQRLPGAVYERLEDACRWIMARLWPPGHAYLRETIQTMGRILNDLLITFEEHMVETRPDSGIWRTGKFYKIPQWDPEEYHALMVEYEFHGALVEDLCFELTRYGNLIASIVRAEVGPMYRFEQGALLIRYGVDIIWRDTTYRPESSAAEIAGEQQPYTTLDEFLKVRTTREFSEAKVGSPRTVAGRQDPTKRPGSGSRE